MELVYHNRKTKRSLYSKVKIPTRKGDYNYLLRVDNGFKWVKIGTTNDMLRRMKEHMKYYDSDITIIWISPPYSKYTTLRVEDRNKALWIKEHPDWQYINNDRFIIPDTVNEIVIKVIKEYHIRIKD